MPARLRVITLHRIRGRYWRSKMLQQSGNLSGSAKHIRGERVGSAGETVEHKT